MSKSAPSGKPHIPVEIEQKIKTSMGEVDALIAEAAAIQKTTFSGKFSLSYRHSVKDAEDILTDFERAQSVCFVSRYENLPIFEGLEIIEDSGKFYVKNIGDIRHILNEYRSIISNESDSIHFGKIHGFCFVKLKNRDETKGLSITVFNEKEEDVTGTFLEILGERHKSIKHILSKTEYGYIYNGILQHSDHKYTKRFNEEYYTGKINYIFSKHAALLGFIKDTLHLHYRIMNQLTFPKLGPL